MSQSRKLYIKLAQGFRTHKPQPGNPQFSTEALATWCLVLFATATALKEENANFDREKFYAAAGYEPAKAGARR